MMGIYVLNISSHDFYETDEHYQRVNIVIMYKKQLVV